MAEMAMRVGVKHDFGVNAASENESYYDVAVALAIVDGEEIEIGERIGGPVVSTTQGAFVFLKEYGRNISKGPRLDGIDSVIERTTKGIRVVNPIREPTMAHQEVIRLIQARECQTEMTFLGKRVIVAALSKLEQRVDHSVEGSRAIYIRKVIRLALVDCNPEALKELFLESLDQDNRAPISSIPLYSI